METSIKRVKIRASFYSETVSMKYNIKGRFPFIMQQYITHYFQTKVDQFCQSDRLVAAHHNILTYISEFPSRYVRDIKEESSLGIRGTHSIYKFLYTFLLNIYGEMFILIPRIVFVFVVYSRDQISMKN